jgi:hypothetical protein
MSQMVTIGAVVLALSGLGASSALAADQPIPDMGSKENARTKCEEIGGQFHVTDQGNLWCFFPDGGMWTCDGNGNECTYYPPFTVPTNTHPPVDGGGVLDGGGADQGIADPGGAPPSAPVVVLPGENQQPATTLPAPSHSKKGKKHGHHSKR